MIMERKYETTNSITLFSENFRTVCLRILAHGRMNRIVNDFHLMKLDFQSMIPFKLFLNTTLQQSNFDIYF